MNKVDDRYRRDKTFRSIVNSSSISSEINTEEAIDAIYQMERDLKKILASRDNRDFTLKYIGEFRLSAFNLKRKTSYFISLYRKGRISDKTLIRDTYLDFKKKQKEKILKYNERALKWCKKKGISLEEFRKNNK